MTQQESRPGQRASNLRLALVLLSIVVVFFAGIVAKKMLLG